MTEQQMVQLARISAGHKFLREIFVIWAAIFVFPFKTLRILAWKWSEWINENEVWIRDGHHKWLKAQGWYERITKS